jgi:hypothetical protein
MQGGGLVKIAHILWIWNSMVKSKEIGQADGNQKFANSFYCSLY